MVWTIIFKNEKTDGINVMRVCGPLSTESIMAYLKKDNIDNVIALIKGDHSVWDPATGSWLSCLSPRAKMERHDLYNIHDDAMG